MNDAELLDAYQAQQKEIARYRSQDVDWDLLKATQDSLAECMQEISRLKERNNVLELAERSATAWVRDLTIQLDATKARQGEAVAELEWYEEGEWYISWVGNWKPERGLHKLYTAPPVREGKWVCTCGTTTNECIGTNDTCGYRPSTPLREGWVRAIDEALVCWHIGIADAADTYEAAKEKLHKLISIEIDAATDPAVNGGKVLVPREPTDAMVQAAENAEDVMYYQAEGVYKAMIAATTDYEEGK